MEGDRRVAIHYRRPPNGLRIYHQRVVEEQEDVIITLSQPLDLSEPMVYQGDVMLEPASLALWFTFPGVWHDIGRFHRADGTFSGLYANILTPPVLDGAVWHTTDLFLDIWCPSGGGVSLLDEDEFEEAAALGYMDAETSARARVEADGLLKLAAVGAWPPSIVNEWTLARALERTGG